MSFDLKNTEEVERYETCWEHSNRACDKCTDKKCPNNLSNIKIRHLDEIGEFTVVNDINGFQVQKALMQAGFVLRGQKIDGNEISFTILKPIEKFVFRREN